MSKILLAVWVSMGFGLVTVQAQMRVGQPAGMPDKSAALDINGGPYTTGSQYRGIVPPKVSLTKSSLATPITDPAQGLLIYNTAKTGDVTPGYYYWEGTKWLRFNTINPNGARTEAIGDYIPGYTLAGLKALNTPIDNVILVDPGKEGLFHLATDGTNNDGTIIVTAGGQHYKRAFNGAVDIKWFGAVGDSLTDDTMPMANAIAAAVESPTKTLYLPGGRYRVTTGSLTISSSLAIKGQNGAKVTTANSSTGTIFNVTGNDVSFENISFWGPNGDVKAVTTNYASRITVNKINCNLIGLLRANYSDNINVTYCTAANSYTASTRGSLACVDLNFTSYVTVDHCTLNGYNFGVQYWGGDANPPGGPVLALNATHGCTDITVSNSTSNDNYAGFWGSGGRNIIFDNLKTKTSRDVGLDFEGTINSVIRNSTVENAINGGLATFYLCDSIQWIHNKSIVSGTVSGTACRAFVLAGTVGLSGSLRIEDLEVKASTESYGGYLPGAGGAYNDLMITNSKFVNVGLDLSSVGSHRQTFRDNLFRLTTGILGTQLNPLTAGNCISVGSERGELKLERNKFINQVAKNSNTFSGNGPQFYHSNDNNSAPYTLINDNEFDGFNNDFIISNQQSTASAATQAMAFVTNNKLFHNSVVTTAGTGTMLAVAVDYRGNTYGNINATINGVNNRGVGTIDWTGGNTPGGLVGFNSSGNMALSSVDPTKFITAISGVTGGNSGNAPILTIPISTESTYDNSNIIVSLGGWDGNAKTLNVVVGNRGGFHISYQQTGNGAAPGALSAYENNDKSVTLYVNQGAFGRAAVTYLNLVQSTAVSAINFVSSSLPGTRVFDSASTYPDNTQPGDVEITDATRGVILRAPNGTRYRITVSNSGVLSTTTP